MEIGIYTFNKMIREGAATDRSENAQNLVTDMDYIKTIMNDLKEYTTEYESMFCYTNCDDEIYIYILTRTQIIKFTLLEHDCDYVVESFLVSDIKKVTINNSHKVTDCQYTIDFGFDKIFIECITDYEDIRSFFKRVIKLR